MSLSFNFSLSGPGLWYATRSAGVVTLVLLTASMVLGILNAGRFASNRWPRFLVQGLHRNFSLLAIGFLAVHILTNLIDSYVSFNLPDMFIPFLSDYKRFWLALGVIASDLMIAVAITSLGRQRLGHKSWRLIHWAAYVSWPLGMVHALGIGTDNKTTWVLITAFLCVASVVAAIGYRAMQALPARGVAR